MMGIAKALAKRSEGYREKPYRCPAGIWTGGWGHAFAPGEIVRSLPPPEAEVVLDRDLAVADRAAVRLCPVLLLESEGRRAAIADFVFNLGSGRLRASTLRRRVNQRRWGDVAMELRRWVRGGGRILPGLVARREAEAALVRTSG